MKQNRDEYAIISNAIDILCIVCAANKDTVINWLTGYLWDEEEAKGIKKSEGKSKWDKKTK